MKVFRLVRHLGEFVLMGLGLIVIPFIPRTAIVWLARGLGSVALGVASFDRRVAFANLDIAFGDTRTATEKRAIVREAFQTFALVALDYFWFALFTDRRVRRYVSMDDGIRACFQRAPLIAVTAHFGNWEIMGQTAAVFGAPTVSVAAPVKNRWVDWAIGGFRKSSGQGVAYRQGAVKTLIRTLKEGGRTALLMDQNTEPREGGEFVDFFHLPVPVSRIVGLLAAKTGAHVVFAFCSADRHGHYHMRTAGPVLSGITSSDIHTVTQQVTRVIEEEVRNHPGQWLWMYRRWRFIPPGRDAAGYPFYARPCRT